MRRPPEWLDALMAEPINPDDIVVHSTEVNPMWLMIYPTGF